jgi:branched-chain amino acid transport system ATP-binding protein
MLELHKVSAGYGQIEALRDVSLTVQQGEIVTLIGANGAGKSTLLMTLCGNPHASAGSIRFDGADITHEDTASIMRRGIAIVPEGRRIFSALSIEENLHLGAFFMSKEQREESLSQVFALFPRLRERLQQRGGTLSGGEQQMLAIARALMSRPQLLLLDEPSLGLAPLIIQQIFETLGALRDQGMTIFLVEQNAHQALKLADRGYVLENGRVVLEGSGAALLQDEAVRMAYLGSRQPIDPAR